MLLSLRKRICNSELLISSSPAFLIRLRYRMKPIPSFRILLKKNGYSDKIVKEIWKWYDFSERKGAASF